MLHLVRVTTIAPYAILAVKNLFLACYDAGILKQQGDSRIEYHERFSVVWCGCHSVAPRDGSNPTELEHGSKSFWIYSARPLPLLSARHTGYS